VPDRYSRRVSGPPPISALELIRASTADVHQALESTLEVARPDAGEAAYGRYLAALLGWLEPLEQRLWSLEWPSPVVPALRTGKTRWIEADLRARGSSAAQISALPRQRALPPMSSLAQRFGAAYVVEGAQLGGQVLLRRLGPRLAPLPARWLEGYGHDTGGRWRSFLTALGSSVHERADAELAAGSARVTFELAQAWFAARGVA
jgi:heme oxygenase